jgi:hypothetical protein
MVQRPDSTRFFEEGKQLIARNSTRVHELASDVLARAGRATGQVEATVESAVQAGRERGNELGGLARGQLKRQLSAVGLATKGDVRNETRGSFEELAGVITSLIDQGRRSTAELREAMHEELQRELTALNVATKDDLALLEARVTKTIAKTPRRSSAGKASPPA